MSRSNDTNNSPLSLDTIDEDRVRRALGLKTGGGTTHQQRPEQARQRHRFVSDGAVPVVMLNRSDSETSNLKDRIASLEHTLENERAAHNNTRRTLHDAQQALQALQTRFGHTELSNNEAKREANALIETLRAELAAAKAAAAAAAAVPAPAPVVAAPAAPQRRKIKASEPIPRQKRDPAEPKPVRWWTPSYRAKQR